MITGNEPAYPSDKEYTEGGKDFLDAPIIVHRQSFGLTKREYFAASAMQGIISTGKCTVGDYVGADEAAVNAVSYADALIAELNKQ